MLQEKKLIRITTVPISLKVLLRQQLRFMSDHYKVLAVSSPGKVLDEVAEAEGVKTTPVTMTRSITPLQDLKALWQLYRLFKKERPSIVHTHTPKAGLLGMMAAKLAGVPVRMHTVAGLPLMESTGKKKKVLELVEKLTYASATKVYPNSKNLAEYILQNKYCKAGKIKVLGNGSSNGINTEHFQPTSEIIAASNNIKVKLGIKPTDFVFVFIGRLVKDKGLVELVEAFVKLHQSYPQAKLLLVGPYEQELDPLPAHILQLIQQEPAILQVDFQQDVRPYLAASQVLAFPSYREGFPNVPMQAGCFGLPSIVTDINGCNEIVIPDQNGLIVPPKNTQALQAAMERLLNDELLYSRLQRNARPMIVERYDQKIIWNLLLQEYQELQQQHEHVSKLSQAFA